MATKKKSKKEIKKVAEESLDGKWGSGRERDILLRDAGYDPVEIQRERFVIRAERAEAAAKESS